MKKKVFLFAYTQTNLGDDLFIEYMLKKYPQIDFEIFIPDEINIEAFKKFKNLKIYQKPDRKLDLINIKGYDAIAFVSGSIFMENVGNGLKLMKEYEKFVKDCFLQGIPFFYISSNFGPYTTNEFIESAKNTFKNCKNICFRDKYSYNLFKDIKSVTYAPDLIFSYNLPKRAIKKDTVGITVIDLSIRDNLKQYEETYYNVLKNSIINFIQNNKQIYLFSFCELEGDTNAISKLLKYLPEDVKKYIHTIVYKGNIKEFLSLYANMEYMICTRFHATILSTMLLQKAYHITYSNKTINVIQDLKLNSEYRTIQSLKQEDSIAFDMFKTVNVKKVKKIKEESKQQLKAFNSYI